MNKKLCHQLLTEIYNKSENLFEELKKLKYDASLNSYNNHYIKIDNKLVKQKYFMPVITIRDKGDICLNFDIVEFEFYISKDNLVNNVNLNKLISEYKDVLSIYKLEDCTFDLYKVGDTVQSLLTKVNNIKDNKFGISINCSDFSNNSIIEHFNNICLLLNI